MVAIARTTTLLASLRPKKLGEAVKQWILSQRWKGLLDKWEIDRGVGNRMETQQASFNTKLETSVATRMDAIANSTHEAQQQMEQTLDSRMDAFEKRIAAMEMPSATATLPSGPRAFAPRAQNAPADPCAVWVGTFTKEFTRSYFERHYEQYLRPLVETTAASQVQLGARAFADSYSLQLPSADAVQNFLAKVYDSEFSCNGRPLRIRRDRTPAQRLHARCLGKVWSRFWAHLSGSTLLPEQAKLVVDSVRCILLLALQDGSTMHICALSLAAPESEDLFKMSFDPATCTAFKMSESLTAGWASEALDSLKPRA